MEVVLERSSPELKNEQSSSLSVIPVLTLSAVSVTVPERRESILDTLNLTINPGERIAIVGPTGSGKTALLEAIAGIRQYTGKITFSHATSSFTAEESVALCPQIPRFFSDSIERNILFWNRGNPDPSAMNKLLDELFTAEERGDAKDKNFLDRIVDSRSGLSGGQRQRLTLARTLLSTPPIVLLDNPFSALDPAREAQTISQLSHWIGDRTLIIATNRLAPLALVNRILVLVEGKIVEDGSMEDLKNERTGWFARFFHQQLMNSSSPNEVGHE
jgi:ABC-type bacteriocin/lantibiotic exporter with double-glycine peptidase domain